MVMLDKLASLIQALFVVILCGIALIVTVYISYITIPVIILSVVGTIAYIYFRN